jgi:hypothetical protein
MARAPQPIVEPWKLLTIGAAFPPGLNTADEVTEIGINETPDGYGYDLSVDGVIKKGTIPTGTSRIERTVTLSTVPYKFHYGRLWNITGQAASPATSNILVYGAHGYDDVYHPFRNGKLAFTEDANPILDTLPVGADELLLPKTTGSYVLSNLNDTRGFWPRTGLIQELRCPTAGQSIELDGVGYVSNARGMWAWNRGTSVEITRKVRDDVTNFSNVALTADYEKKYIKGGTSFVYEVPTEKLFRWSASLFRYTTKQFHLPKWESFTVDGIIATLRHTDTDDGWFTYQVKYEDGNWSEAETVNALYESENFTNVRFGLENVTSAHRFQLRVTDMSANIVFKQFRLDLQDFDIDSYSV